MAQARPRRFDRRLGARRAGQFPSVANRSTHADPPACAPGLSYLPQEASDFSASSVRENVRQTAARCRWQTLSRTELSRGSMALLKDACA
jgi:ABC-type lipopolysaccharide export system ATPase subunit